MDNNILQPCFLKETHAKERLPQQQLRETWFGSKMDLRNVWWQYDTWKRSVSGNIWHEPIFLRFRLSEKFLPYAMVYRNEQLFTNMLL